MDPAVVLIIVIMLLAAGGLFAYRYYALRLQIVSMRNEQISAATQEAQTQLEQWRETDMVRLRAEQFELARQEALAQFAQWRENDASLIRTEQRELARQEALLQIEQWKKDQEQLIRVDAVQRSQSVIIGRVTEHFIPYLPDFAYNPKDARFLGSPVDFVIFDGLDGGEIRQVVFVEIKTGKSALTTRERQIREAIQSGRVGWVELRSSQQFQQQVA